MADTSGDGTTVTVTSDTTVVAQINGHPPVTLTSEQVTGIRAVAANGGQGIVIWESPAGSTSVLFARPDGTFSAPTEIVGKPAGLAANDAGDAAVVLDVQATAGGSEPQHEYRLAVRAPGGDFGSPILMQREPATIHAVAVGGAGDTFVAMTTGNPPIYRVVARPHYGSSAYPVAEFEATGAVPSLVADAHGRALLAWIDQASRRLSLATGTTLNQWSREIPPSVTSGQRVHAATDPDGHAVVAWRDVGVLKVATGNLGRGFSSPRVVDPDSGGLGDPGVAIGPDGTTVIVERGPTASSVRVVRRDGLGPFLGPQTVTCTTGQPSFSVSGVTDDGTATVQIGDQLFGDAPVAAPPAQVACPGDPPDGTVGTEVSKDTAWALVATDKQVVWLTSDGLLHVLSEQGGESLVPVPCVVQDGTKTDGPVCGPFQIGHDASGADVAVTTVFDVVAQRSRAIVIPLDGGRPYRLRKAPLPFGTGSVTLWGKRIMIAVIGRSLKERGIFVRARGQWKRLGRADARQLEVRSRYALIDARKSRDDAHDLRVLDLAHPGHRRTIATNGLEGCRGSSGSYAGYDDVQLTRRYAYLSSYGAACTLEADIHLTTNICRFDLRDLGHVDYWQTPQPIGPFRMVGDRLYGMQRPDDLFAPKPGILRYEPDWQSATDTTSDPCFIHIPKSR